LDFRRLKYYCHNSLILVTSGDRQILSAIAEVLTAEKYDFITENNGEKAWEIILQKKPAIVIADWAIPDVSGLALCHRCKSSLEHPELMAIYFVLSVEDSNSQQRQIGLDTGVDEFLNNSIDSSELKARVRTGLRLTALTQSLTWANQRLLAQNDLLEALNLSDSLTKVLSEQAFADAMPKMMQQLKGLSNYKSYYFLSVLIIDIDLFKPIVESYGEKIGNEAINAIAGRLSHSCMPNSLIYRHGLDEFVCVTPHSDAASGAELSLNLLSSIRSHPIAVSSGLLFPLTISIGGVVTVLENQNQQIPDLSFDELVSLAEQSLLQAQKSGGDRDYIEIFE
jgi:two-component system, cell cycle response regulator